MTNINKSIGYHYLYNFCHWKYNMLLQGHVTDGYQMKCKASLQDVIIHVKLTGCQFLLYICCCKYLTDISCFFTEQLQLANWWWYRYPFISYRISLYFINSTEDTFVLLSCIFQLLYLTWMLPCILMNDTTISRSLLSYKKHLYCSHTPR